MIVFVDIYQPPHVSRTKKKISDVMIGLITFLHGDKKWHKKNLRMALQSVRSRSASCVMAFQLSLASYIVQPSKMFDTAENLHLKFPG